jgi:hypothetical protein
MAEAVETVIKSTLPEPKDTLFEREEIQVRLSEFKAIQHSVNCYVLLSSDTVQAPTERQRFGFRFATVGVWIKRRRPVLRSFYVCVVGRSMGLKQTVSSRTITVFP